MQATKRMLDEKYFEVTKLKEESSNRSGQVNELRQ